MTTVESLSRDDCVTAGILPGIITSESMGPNFSEPIDGNLSSCGDDWINDYSTGDLHGAALRRQPEALPNEAEIVYVDATNNRAHHSGKRVKFDITEQELRQYFGHTRKEVADFFGVSISTIKRRCRSNGIGRWRHRTASNDERNTCPTFKPPTHGQTQMVGPLHKPNEVPLPPDRFDGVNSGNRESSIAAGLTPTSLDDWAGNNLAMEFSFSSLLDVIGEASGVSGSYEGALASGLSGSYEGASGSYEGALASGVSGSYEGAFKQKDQIADLECVQPQKASKEMVSEKPPGSSDLASPVEARFEGHGQTVSITEQDTGLVTIKAMYKDSIIKVQLPRTSGLTELNEEVAKKLKLKLDSFKIEYEDEDEEWILMTCDKELRDYTSLVKPPNKLKVSALAN